MRLCSAKPFWAWKGILILQFNHCLGTRHHCLNSLSPLSWQRKKERSLGCHLGIIMEELGSPSHHSVRASLVTQGSLRVGVKTCQSARHKGNRLRWICSCLAHSLFFKAGKRPGFSQAQMNLRMKTEEKIIFNFLCGGCITSSAKWRTWTNKTSTYLINIMEKPFCVWVQTFWTQVENFLWCTVDLKALRPR